MNHILFVCIHNAGRSQMAAAFFNQLARERSLSIRALSAGTEPAKKVHDGVVASMMECGIDLSDARPRLLTNHMAEQAQQVITMGCAVDAEACPALLLQDVEDWGLPDPAAQNADTVRQIRDEIRRRVQDMIDSLTPVPLQP